MQGDFQPPQADDPQDRPAAGEDAGMGFDDAPAAIAQDIVANEAPAGGDAPVEGVRPPADGVFTRLRRALGWASSEERLSDLTRAIEDAPAAAVNYLLRGELHLARRDDALALADLEQAAALAAGEYAASDWGLSAQVVQDRALAGLQRLAARHSGPAPERNPES